MMLHFFAISQAGISAINRSGTQYEQVVTGDIVEKNITDNRGIIRHYLEVYDEKLGRVVDLRVSESVFNNYQVGQTYHKAVSLGSLGYIYHRE
ncbi:MAG: hypothetical protein WBB45_15825 [Cyclobacteriaceae bacterium]